MSFETLGEGTPRMGVLGASRIVEKALLQEANGLVDVVAVAARELSRARSYANQKGIPVAYGSYEELIEDSTIPLIYNALPASGHAPWSELALRAGKHVLCEKPFGLDAAEARHCVRVAEEENRLLMEAHHWRYHPLVEQAAGAFRELGELGQPIAIEAHFSGGLNNPKDIRLNPSLGPGVMMDFGCYTLQWCVFAAESAMLLGASVSPRIVRSKLVDGEPNIDLCAQVVMGFGGQTSVPCSAEFLCDMRDGIKFRAFLRAQAGDRQVHWENPLGVDGSWLVVSQGDREVSRQAASGLTTYSAQLRAFLAALRTGTPPLTSGQNIIDTQQLLDDCYAIAGSFTRKELQKRAGLMSLMAD